MRYALLLLLASLFVFHEGSSAVERLAARLSLTSAQPLAWAAIVAVWLAGVVVVIGRQSRLGR